MRRTGLVLLVLILAGCGHELVPESPPGPGVESYVPPADEAVNHGDVDFMVEVTIRGGFQATSLFATESYRTVAREDRAPELNFTWSPELVQRIHTDEGPPLYLVRVDGYGSAKDHIVNPLAAFADHIAYTHSVSGCGAHTISFPTRGFGEPDARVPFLAHAARYEDAPPEIRSLVWNTNVNMMHGFGALEVVDEQDFIELGHALGVELSFDEPNAYVPTTVDGPVDPEVLKADFGYEDPTVVLGEGYPTHMGRAFAHVYQAFSRPGMLRSVAVNVGGRYDAWRDEAPTMDNPGSRAGRYATVLTRVLGAFLSYASVTPSPYRDDGSTIADSLLITITSEANRGVLRTEFENPLCYSQSLVAIGSKVRGGSYGDTDVGGAFPGDRFGYDYIRVFDEETGSVGVSGAEADVDPDELLYDPARIYATTLRLANVGEDDVAAYTDAEPIPVLVR